MSTYVLLITVNCDHIKKEYKTVYMPTYIQTHKYTILHIKIKKML